MKRKWVWMGMGLVVLGLAAVAGFLLFWQEPEPPTPMRTPIEKSFQIDACAIIEATCANIKMGMTPEEVAKAMGCPPGCYCSATAAWRKLPGYDVPHEGDKVGFVERWVGETCHLTVYYLDGKALGACFFPGSDGNGNWNNGKGPVYFQ